MQATVFDFTFRLRQRDKEIYLSRTETVYISVDYRLINIADRSRNFRIRSGVSGEESTQLDFNDFLETNGSPYSESVGVFGDMFGLSSDSNFNYSPEILIRRSNYPKILISRINSKKGFLTTDLLFLVRPSVFGSIINPENSIYLSKWMSKSSTTSIEARVLEGEASLNTEDTAEFSSYGRLIILGESRGRRLIGGSRVKAKKYHERTNLKSLKSSTFNFSVTIPRDSFSGVTMKISIAFRVRDSALEIEPSRYKYAILSLNTDIIGYLYFKRKMGRLTIKEK